MRTDHDEASYIKHISTVCTFYMNYVFFLPIALCLLLSACSIKPVRKTKNVTYSASNNLQLDVYAPQKLKEPKKLLLFVHGGNWIHGKKSIYRFYGKGLARKGLIGVVINYRLSPTANYEGMATDVATAVKWVKDNCSAFGGDTSNIYISGHSAGAQLAGLVAYDDSYFKKLGIQNPIKGTVLIDAFGLDMYRYFSLSTSEKDTMYKRVFTNDPATWKKASPAWHLSKGNPPTLMFVGGKTYPVIKQVNNEFYAQLTHYQSNAQLIIVKGKSHAPMIFQFINPRVKAYRQILEFMEVERGN
jgi:acetyl esterase/lipase